MKIALSPAWRMVESLQAPEVLLHWRTSGKRGISWFAWDPAIPATIREIERANHSGGPLRLANKRSEVVYPHGNSLCRFNPRLKTTVSQQVAAEDCAVVDFWLAPDESEVFFVRCKESPSRKEVVALFSEQAKNGQLGTQSVSVNQSDFQLCRSELGRSEEATEHFQIPGKYQSGEFDWQTRTFYACVFPGNRFLELNLESGQVRWAAIDKMHKVSLSPSAQPLAWSPWATTVRGIDFSGRESKAMLDDATDPSYSPTGVLMIKRRNGIWISLPGQQSFEKVADFPDNDDLPMIYHRWCPCGHHFVAWHCYDTPEGRAIAFDIKRREAIRIPYLDQSGCIWYPREQLDVPVV